MATLNIGDKKVTIDDGFLKLSPEQQNATVEEISKSLPQRTWTGALGEAVGNVPESAVKFGSDLVQPFLHPIDTAVNVANLGMGVMEKLGFDKTSGHEKYADAVGQFLKERYGSVENIKRTLATDPVGMASDISTVFSGGGSLAARAPGIIGKIGEASEVAGRYTNPLSSVPVNAIGKGASQIIGGLGTHTGAESLQTAASAGKQGGAAAQAFQENLRGTAPMQDAVDDARRAVAQIRRERGDEYRAGMQAVSTDRQILNFDKVDEAIRRAGGVATFKGQDLSPTTKAIRESISDTVDAWRALDPAEFHTAEGLDALKRKIGDIRDGTQAGTPERVVAERVYHGVRETIIDRWPDYARVMRGYEEASTILKEIEKTLSLNPNATVDTSLRKLQSTLRDNVNTSFGRRKELLEYLINAGAPHLMERLAGQALKPWLPRGLGKLQLAGNEMAAGAVGAGTMIGAKAIPIAAMASPRLMGEAAYYAGKASNLPLRAGGQASRALGVADDALSPGAP